MLKFTKTLDLKWCSRCGKYTKSGIFGICLDCRCVRSESDNNSTPHIGVRRVPRNSAPTPTPARGPYED